MDGKNTAMKTVTVYTRKGEAKQLPELNTARYHLGCSSYIDSDGNQVGGWRCLNVSSFSDSSGVVSDWRSDWRSYNWDSVLLNRDIDILFFLMAAHFLSFISVFFNENIDLLFLLLLLLFLSFISDSFLLGVRSLSANPEIWTEIGKYSQHSLRIR